MCCWEGLGHSRFEGLQLEQPWEILHPIPALQFLVPDLVPVPKSHRSPPLLPSLCSPNTPHQPLSAFLLPSSSSPHATP